MVPLVATLQRRHEEPRAVRFARSLRNGNTRGDRTPLKTPLLQVKAGTSSAIAHY